MKLNKYDKNPILTAKGDSWEGLCVLNPAVVYDEADKEFKMLYRAAGNDKTHHIYLGLAVSKDGFNFTRVSDKPVLSPDLAQSEFSGGGDAEAFVQSPDAA